MTVKLMTLMSLIPSNFREPNQPEILGPAGLKSNPDQKRLIYLVRADH